MNFHLTFISTQVPIGICVLCPAVKVWVDLKLGQVFSSIPKTPKRPCALLQVILRVRKLQTWKKRIRLILREGFRSTVKHVRLQRNHFLPHCTKALGTKGLLSGKGEESCSKDAS